MGIMEKKMATTIVYGGNMRIMETSNAFASVTLVAARRSSDPKANGIWGIVKIMVPF